VEDIPVFDEEQHFVGTSLHQHSPSCNLILVFNARFDFEKNRGLYDI